MITWIAGWPHNGSTLLRQIIKDCFEIPSYSKYKEPELEFLFGKEAAKFSELWNIASLEQYQRCRRGKELFVVKTHEIPFDDSPAIFVVRDGRDAVTTLSRFWATPIANMIVGQGCVFGTWSGYYYAWQPKKRPKTIIVRYEDMVTQPQKVVADIAPMLGCEPKRPFVDKYEQNKGQWPQLFNGTMGIWQEEMTEADLELFWQCHGDVMKELGYE